MKETFHGYSIYNFGSNNDSYGMEAIIFDPKEVTSKEVSKLQGVFLHPTEEPNSFGIFAIRGSQEQFDLFFNEAVQAHCTKQAIKELGIKDIINLPTEKFALLSELIDEKVMSFKPWYC